MGATTGWAAESELEIWHGKTNPRDTATEKIATNSHPSILIESGSSGAAVGEIWLKQRTNGANLTMSNSARPFRFGDGVERRILGAFALPITIAPESDNQIKSANLQVAVDVAMAEVPLIISKKTLVAMQGQLDFPTSALSIDDDVTTHLIILPSGQIVPPGAFFPILPTDSGFVEKFTGLAIKTRHRRPWDYILS